MVHAQSHLSQLSSSRTASSEIHPRTSSHSCRHPCSLSSVAPYRLLPRRSSRSAGEKYSVVRIDSLVGRWST